MKLSAKVLCAVLLIPAVSLFHLGCTKKAAKVDASTQNSYDEPSVEPVAVSRVGIPVPDKAPPPAPATARTSLSDRLARRLDTATPPSSRQDKVKAPDLAEIPPPEATRAIPGLAPPPSRTGSLPSGTVDDPVLAWYLADLQRELYKRWSPPSEFFQRGSPVALVTFRIDRSGRISDVGFKERSGSKRYDDTTLAAVQALGRTSPLPEQYREETLDVVINFQIPQ